jgi:hypothetical protein
MGILGPTAGESFAAHMGVPDEYPGGNELCRDLDDAMYEAGLWLLREQQAADPVLRAMMDDRYRLLELVDGVSVGSLPPGIEITYRADHRIANGVVRARRDGDPSVYVNIEWEGDYRNYSSWHPSLRPEVAVSAWLPVPLDVSALIAVVAAENNQAVPRPPRPPRPPVDWSIYGECTRPGCWALAKRACFDVRSTWSKPRRHARRPHPGRPRIDIPAQLT